MSKKIKILSLVVLICLSCVFLGACDLNYGTPDDLGVGSMSVGERILSGLQVAALGVGVVFAVLVILVILCYVLEYAIKLMLAVSSKKSKKAQDKKVNVPQTAAPAPVASSDSVDEEIAAAISAALMAYYDAQAAEEEEEEVEYSSSIKFVVRSIKEIK